MYKCRKFAVDESFSAAAASSPSRAGVSQRYDDAHPPLASIQESPIMSSKHSKKRSVKDRNSVAVPVPLNFCYQIYMY